MPHGTAKWSTGQTLAAYTGPHQPPTIDNKWRRDSKCPRVRKLKVSSSDIKSSAIKVGIRDRQMSGWCNDEKGELVSDVFVKPGMNVVDVGCGDGGYVNFCAKMGANVTFVDIQEGKVHALEERLKANASGEVKGIVSDCNPIPIPDGHADLVISTEVLEHVRNPAEFLSEIVRIGSQDATWVLTVPEARGENLVKGIAPQVY